MLVDKLRFAGVKVKNGKRPSLICNFYVFFMFSRLHDMLEVPSPDVLHLTACFFVLNFCAATQDIAVDGWALTMLSPKNVGLASTCNSVGQVS